MVTLAHMVETLLEHYGARGWWPIVTERGQRPCYLPEQWRETRSPSEVFEIGVGAVLTQRAVWSHVADVVAKLSAVGALQPQGMLALDPVALESAIRSTGTFRRKAQSLRAWAAWCLEHSVRESDKELDHLDELPGFGPETVDSVLLYGLGRPRFIADAYARRILVRFGYTDSARNYRHLQAQVHDRESLDRRQCDEGHALLVELGKRHCHVQPQCQGCPLESNCSKRF